MMFKGFYIILLTLLPPVLSMGQLSSNAWGTNKYIDDLSEKCVVSVAENGWIYLLHHYNSSLTTDENGWKIYCSVDGGLNFVEKEHIQYSSFVLRLVSADMVVAGDDPGNIRVFVAELTNAGEAAWEEGSFRIYEYDGAETKVIYETPREYDSSYSVSVACDSRAPAAASAPYTIAAAWSGYGGDIMEDQLHYVFSDDGGASFNDTVIFASSRIRNVDLALGSTSLYPDGYFALAFELNSGIPSEYSDIGLLINDIKNTGMLWTGPFLLSVIYPSEQPILSRPSVCLMQDAGDHAEGSDFVPIVLFAQDRSQANNHDLLMLNFSSEYAFEGEQAVYPDSAELVLSYPFGNLSVKQEINPQLVYDPGANNFLITYSTILFKELIYAGINITDLEVNEWWSEGSYRSNTGNLPTEPKPHIDIDPSRGKAVFSWRDEYVNPISPSKSYFDTEWWIVGTDDQPAVTDPMIFPNPASEFISISNAPRHKHKYALISLDGKRIVEGESAEGTYIIHLPSDIPMGIYVFIIQDNTHIYRQKVIIN